MKDGMRDDLMLTRRDFLLQMGIRTDKMQKEPARYGKKQSGKPGMKKRSILFGIAFLCFILAFALFFMFPAFAEEEPAVVASGYCGASFRRESMTWTLTEDGTLTFSGSGYMWVGIYSEVAESIAETPWKPYRDRVRRLVLEEGVQTISYAAFRDFTALTEVSLPDSLISIAIRAFKGCTALTDINIPDGLKTVNEETFLGCVSLSHLSLPDSILYICSSAFSGSGITEIDIPDRVTEIQQRAFSQCADLTRVGFPADLREVGVSAFYGCPALADVALPEGTTKISDYAFCGCTGLTRVSLPCGLTRIGTYAFSGCSSLTDIDIPDSVTQMDTGAFSGCAALETVHVPEGLQSIYPYVFKGCRNLKSVTIPESAVYIYIGAFEDCSSIESIYIPANVKFFQELAFVGMDSLLSFEVSEENPYFSAGEYGCLYSKDHTVLAAYPGGRDTSAFTVPEYVEKIERSAFAELNALESVSFPASVTEIAPGAFYRCPNIVSFTVDPENPALRCVNNCVIAPQTQELVLACKTGRIPEDGSVTRIRSKAFVNTGRSVTVPGCIVEFGEDIFTGCGTLESAVLAPGITKTGYRMFPITVKTIVIPDTVTFIEAFLVEAAQYATFTPPCDLEIYYTGSEEQWNAVHIENWYEALPNSNLLVASKYFGYRFTEIGGTSSTCAVSGYTAGLYCDVTGTWVSGHEALPLTDHTPGAAVKENITAATCTSNGGYDEVVYCVNCPAELSRTHVETSSTGHVWGEWEVVKQATTSEEGLMRRVCLNDPGHVEEEVIPKLQPQTGAFQQFIERIRDFFQNIIDWFRRLFRF